MVSTRPARRASRSAQPTSGRTKPVEPDRDEGAVRVETTPHPKARTRPSSPNMHKRFRHDQLAELAGRLNQLPSHTSRLSQHVSTSERLSRNHPATEKQTRPQATMVSTRPARRANRSAQPASERAKPVEPDCDEGATRVETTRYFLVPPPPVSGSDR